ncbi:MAG: hypothetical protein ACRCUY_01350 [Thermoguttaceae bacterium]
MLSRIFALFWWLFGVFFPILIGTHFINADESPLVLDGPRLSRLDVPPTQEAIQKSIGHGVNFLLEYQNSNGSWGSMKRTKGSDIYTPGSSQDAFRAGTSALALAALIEVEAAIKRSKEPLNPEVIGIDLEKLEEAIERGEWWIRDHLPKLRRSSENCLYNVWGHAFGIQTLVRMLHRFPDDASRNDEIQELIRGQVEMLRRFETINGGWFYYDNNKTSPPSETTACFVSATGLIALNEARQVGIDIPEKMVKTTKQSILRQRLPDFAYLYGDYLRLVPRAEINRPPGSLGRSHVCNLAMRQWGDETVTDAIIISWLHRLIARNGWLSLGRKKPYPHESFFAVAGYFFYYGHYYAACCLSEIPESERPLFQEHLADVLLGLQEKDGSWWDFPMFDYHQSYGTAFAVMSLLRTLQLSPKNM